MWHLCEGIVIGN